MVFINKQAYVDLDFILIGMLEWDKSELSFEFIENYIDEIVDECYKLEKLSYHFNAKYSSHKIFGSKIHRYKRNNRTVWYLIYNIDNEGNIFINRIISNHTTTG